MLDVVEVAGDLAFDDAADVLHLDHQLLVENLPRREISPDADDRRGHERHADQRDPDLYEEACFVPRHPPCAHGPDEHGEDQRPDERGADDRVEQCHAETVSPDARKVGAACWMGTIFDSIACLIAGSARSAASAPRSISSSAR